MTATAPQTAHYAGRSRLLRLFALLAALLVVSVQPRAFALSSPLGSSAPRIVKHAERVESTALRVDTASRVAASPVLARAPSLPVLLTAWRWPSARLAFVPLIVSQRGQPLTHFHSKRRIPRMNSDEPPRG